LAGELETIKPLDRTAKRGNNHSMNVILEPQDVNLVISLLALAVAIAALALAWRVAARDRANLRLHCEYLTVSGLGLGFRLELLNCSRKLITIDDVRLIDNRNQSFSYRSHSMKNTQFSFTLPYMLDEGEKAFLYFPIWHLPSASRDPRDFRRITVVDASGKRWSLSIGSLTRGISDGELFKDKR
jgi:hypothetical protein